MTKECSICTSRVSSVSRWCKCPHCDFECCTSCVQKYIVSSSDDAHCMQCKMKFDRQVITSMLPKSFVSTTYRTHRENIVCEREKAILPHTQDDAVKESKKRKIIQEMKRVAAEKMEAQRVYLRACGQYESLKSQRRRLSDLSGDRSTFVQKCQHGECRGYLSTSWKCGVCERYTCSKCNLPLTDAERQDHQCDPNTAATFDLVKKDCKKCPGCSQYIYKVSGCDQMWCTSCHTCFSWSSGRKLNGRVHNPHYYEYQQRTATDGPAREMNDIPCGGLPDARVLLSGLASILKNLQHEDVVNLMSHHRAVTHVENVVMPAYRGVLDEAQINKDLRIAFLLGDIDMQEFKTKCQRRDKHHEKQKEITMVLAMFVDTSSDIFRSFVIDGDLPTLKQTCSFIQTYVNRSMLNISQQYHCVVPYIDLDDPHTVVSRRA